MNGENKSDIKEMFQKIGDCNCLNRSDKDQIILGMNLLLAKRNSDISNATKDLSERGMIRREDIVDNPTITQYKKLLRDCELTRNRVYRTPEC